MAIDTKQALLAAARDEFAAHGVAGARVDRIAKTAGVNKERIYGYFGSKEKLFDVVVEEALEKLTEGIRVLEDDPVTFVGQHFDFYRDNPQVLRLLMWEALNYREGELPGTKTRREHCAAKIEAFAKALGRQPDREMAYTMMSLMGVALFPLVMPQIGALMLGEEPGEDLRDHVQEFARRALRE